ncbi:MAG TPA: 6-carboxytetrahydropterin synthase [Polyangiaceae bacterium]|nr:6-carboxytetrahydropterin synthase [Polyangiaceae bacterium]
MFVLGVSDHIMIAHSFPDPFFGPAQRVHGATYGVEVELRVAELGPQHVVVDIGAFRTLLRQSLDTLDYRNLDEHPEFRAKFSTTERVAEHIAGLVAEGLRGLDAAQRPPPGSSLRVLLRESPVAWAAYERAL